MSAQVLQSQSQQQQQQRQQQMMQQQQRQTQQHQQLLQYHQQQQQSQQHPPHRAPLTNITLPKQQVATVLNSMTAGGTQLKKMDGYDLANLHAMNVRYLQQVASQRSQQNAHQQPQQQRQHQSSQIPPPSTNLFQAKM